MASIDGSASIQASSDQLFDHSMVSLDGSKSIQVSSDQLFDHSMVSLDGSKSIQVSSDQLFDHATTTIDGSKSIQASSDQLFDLATTNIDGSKSIQASSDQLFDHATTTIDGSKSIQASSDQLFDLATTNIDGSKSIQASSDQLFDHATTTIDGSKSIQASSDQLFDLATTTVDGSKSIQASSDQIFDHAMASVDGSKSIQASSDQIFDHDMASVDGSKSIHASSDQTFEYYCGPCKTEGKEIEARKYCEDCVEYLCDSCVNVHRKFSLLKYHKVKIVAARAAPSRTPGHRLLGRQIQLSKKVNVSLDGDKKIPYITGCVFMPNGFFVACDWNNCHIKLFDSSLSLQDSLQLSSYPWDVSVIDDSTVIITILNRKQLQYVQVLPQFKLGHVIQLDKNCWGVEVSGQDIYVSCRNYCDGEVRVLDKQGNLRRRLGIREDGSYLFLWPFYITVSTAGDKIFVSDYKTDTLTCMEVDGSIVYQYKDTDLKRPRGLYCDDGDNVMVCGFNSNNIHVITSAGKKYGNLLSSQDGLTGPWSVAYRKSDDALVVGCYGSNIVVCQLSE